LGTDLHTLSLPRNFGYSLDDVVVKFSDDLSVIFQFDAASIS
jgi:hypothetical protein